MTKIFVSIFMILNCIEMHLVCKRIDNLEKWVLYLLEQEGILNERE